MNAMRHHRRRPTLPPLPSLVEPPVIVIAPVLAADGTVLRDALAAKAEWRDPEDDNPLARAPKRISGYRRVWTIDVLARERPREMTAQLVRAANRLLSDYEIGVEGASTRVAAGRIDGSDTTGLSDARMQALRAYREATAAIGLAAYPVMMGIVIRNLSLAEAARRTGTNPQVLSGRLLAGLERLAEHYWPPEQRVEVVPLPPLGIDAETALPEARVGRWR